MSGKIDLKYYLMRFRNAKSITRLYITAEMRNYVRTNPFQDTLKQIRHIWDDKDLNILISVGMKGALYYAVLGQKAQAEGLI